MSINETNVTGRKYRVWDAANNIWKRLSFWTKASDVEMNDGTTVEANITTLKGKAGFIGTTAEINEALSQGLIPDGGLVYNTDDNYELDISAGQVIYDNTDTGLLATNVQDAVDELSSDLTGVKSDLGNIKIFPDMSNVIKAEGTLSLPYTTSVNCMLIGHVASSSDGIGNLLVDGLEVAHTYKGASPAIEFEASVQIALKAGSVITSSNVSSNHLIVVGLK